MPQKTFLRLLHRLELEIFLLFFLNWQKFIFNSNYCTRNIPYRIVEYFFFFFVNKTQYWDPDKLAELSRRRLLHLLRKKNYRDYLLLNTTLPAINDFQELPIMSRYDLRKNFSALFEKKTLTHSSYREGTTSGTSGTPLRIAVTEKMNTQNMLLRKRLFGFAGLQPNDMFVYPRTSLHPHYCKENLFIRYDLQSLIDSYVELFSYCKDIGAKALYSFPTIFRLLGEKKIESNYRDIKLTAIFSVGENLSPKMREDIRKAFDAEVYDFYSSVELSSIGQECAMHEGLHINPEFHYIEIISDSNEILSTGNWGRIVITPLEAQIVPIIRYDTGDEGMLTTDICKCGRTLPRLRLRGRKPDLIKTPGGLVSPIAFKEIIDYVDPESLKIERYQIYLTKDLSLTLRVIPTNHFTDDDANLLARICTNFLMGKLKFKLSLNDVLHMNNGKTPLIVRE